MKKHIEDEARKAERISAERHLDLNRLLQEHFCEVPKPKKKKSKRKNKK
jgi:hypothetical protein